ncbi:MAG: hypothetical protein R3Y52_02370 [Psittacicella sp.]
MIYPWFERIYLEMDLAFRKNRLYPSIIVESFLNTGVDIFLSDIAKSILCKEKEGLNFCSKCQNCILASNKNHQDIFLLDDKIISVDKVRELTERLNLHSSNNLSIVIIPNIVSLNNSSINALLKTIEEPKDGVYFLMGSTIDIKDTLRSRSAIYDLRSSDMLTPKSWFIDKIDQKLLSSKEILAEFDLLIETKRKEPLFILDCFENGIIDKKIFFKKELNDFILHRNMSSMLANLGSYEAYELNFVFDWFYDFFELKLISNIKLLKFYIYDNLVKILYLIKDAKIILGKKNNLNLELLLINFLIDLDKLLHG